MCLIYNVEYLNGQFLNSSLFQSAETWNLRWWSIKIPLVFRNATNFAQNVAICARFRFPTNFCFSVDSLYHYASNGIIHYNQPTQQAKAK